MQLKDHSRVNVYGPEVKILEIISSESKGFQHSRRPTGTGVRILSSSG